MDDRKSPHVGCHRGYQHCWHIKSGFEFCCTCGRNRYEKAREASKKGVPAAGDKPSRARLGGEAGREASQTSPSGEAGGTVIKSPRWAKSSPDMICQELLDEVLKTTVGDWWDAMPAPVQELIQTALFTDDGIAGEIKWDAEECLRAVVPEPEWSLKHPGSHRGCVG